MNPPSPGPVDPTPQAHIDQLPLPHNAYRLEADGWLGQWQRRNAEATVPHVLDRVEAGEAWSNLARLVGGSDEPYQGMPFTDSDVYKTIEALAWSGDTVDATTLKRGQRLVELVASAQLSDGYLNSFVQGTPGEERWSDPQWGHELYTAGHLFQAAVAAARTGHLADLIPVATRFADLLVRELGAPDSSYIDGHPEVETALVELYRLTGHREYLELAAAQVDRRGHGWLGPDRFGSSYFQDHEPLRSTTRATGHAVRQLYLLSGAVDVAVERGDTELLDAVERIWADLFHTKTYVSGAHGSRHRDEAIGDSFELPPDRAYAETCAAIASFQLNWRLLIATGRKRYADEMETALYNAIAVSTSVTGTQFFYSNPLQLRTDHDGTHEDAPSRRLPWFSCACCPPNIGRLLASVHDYLVTTTSRALTVQQFTPGRVVATVAGTEVGLTVRTDYPFGEAVTIEVAASDRATAWELGVRVPGWCHSVELSVAGVAVPAVVADGYLRIDRTWVGTTVVQVTFAMPVRLVAPHSHVDAVRGCVAVARGPVLYALEQADLPDDVVLEDVRIIGVAGIHPAGGPDALSPVVIDLDVSVVPSGAQPLYTEAAADATPTGGGRRLWVSALPYHRWGNRTPGGMRVWLPLASPTARLE